MPVYSPSWWGFRSPTPSEPHLRRLPVRCARSMASPWKEPQVGCHVQFSPVNRFCLDGGGAYAPDEIREKSTCIRGVAIDGFLPDYTQSFSTGAGKQSDARKTSRQTRVISDECMIYKCLALSHRGHIVRRLASRRLFLRRSVSLLAPLPSWPGHAVSTANRQAPQARQGCGERIPHQGFAATELQGQILAAGENLAL